MPLRYLRGVSTLVDVLAESPPPLHTFFAPNLSDSSQDSAGHATTRKDMSVVSIESDPLDRLQAQAADNAILIDVALLLREISSTLQELKEHVAGRVKELYTVEEVGEIFGRAPYTVRAWIREGKIRAERVEGTGPKGRLLVPRSELEKLTQAGKGKDVDALTVSQMVIDS